MPWANFERLLEAAAVKMETEQGIQTVYSTTVRF